ncbi:type II and III secretion system protein family protein [Devosia sp. LjRoot16]|uniref:type II and III secretion system protein family protein n=1 Tax=Devosia sp. LjRoot16 TaxID=3342271 RepID=UPI003ED0F00C
MSPALTTRSPRSLMASTLRLMAAAALIGAALGLAPLGLGEAHGADSNHLRIGASSFGSTQPVSIGINKSMIIDLPVDAQEVIVSQPGVANAILRNKRRAVIQAVSSGDTNIFFLDGAGRTIVVVDVSTTGAANTGGSNVAAALRETFRRVMPNSDIQVEAVSLTDADGNVLNRVVLSGNAGSTDDADKAIAIAGQFSGDPKNVTSVITVSGPQQVMLKVTVAEVNRSLAKQFGIDLTGSYSSGGLTTKLISSQPIGGASNLFSDNGLEVGVDIGGLSIDAQIRAMEQRGAARTLAEPVLTAMSGQSADFFAGGEFPVPTSVTDGKVAVEYKDFGVKLAFTPTIKSNGNIALVVDTTSSELSTEGSITVGGSTLLGIKRRTAKTSVEIGTGQTLAIGGLIEDKTRTQIHRLPGLGDIPILGALFRSRDFIRSQSELVILVTPYLAQTTTKKPELPTDRMQFANDAEAIFLGHIETMYGVGPAGTRGSYDGSVGFLLD